MRSFWTDPYLWVHLAGLAALPIFLELCLLGLAMGAPVLPVSLEFLLVAIAGIAPILWMQWQRPFYIFSLLGISLKPQQLSDTQRKLLQLFQSPIRRALSILAAVFLAVVLWQLYRLAPIAAASVAPTQSRFVGVLLAAIAFLLSNLFLQVPVSVLRVLLASEAEFAAAPPYPVEKIAKDFTLIGLRVNRILPPLVTEPTEMELATATAPTTAQISTAASATAAPAPIIEPPPVEPQVAKPQVTEPQVAGSQVAEPQATESPITEPQVAESQVTESPITEPQATEPEVTESQVTEPQASEIEAPEPEVASQPDAAPLEESPMATDEVVDEVIAEVTIASTEIQVESDQGVAEVTIAAVEIQVESTAEPASDETQPDLQDSEQPSETNDSPSVNSEAADNNES